MEPKSIGDKVSITGCRAIQKEGLCTKNNIRDKSDDPSKKKEN
jgi:hypothetical protein